MAAVVNAADDADRGVSGGDAGARNPPPPRAPGSGPSPSPADAFPGTTPDGSTAEGVASGNAGAERTVTGAAEGAVRVMIVDDHPIWRGAVAKDLEAAGYRVVATAANGDEAIVRAAATRPQVVVLDMKMPGISGAEITARLVEADPAVRVLVLSASGEQDDVLQAVKAGAIGYLVKSAETKDLLEAVERTAAGDPVFTPGLAGLVLGEYRRLAGEDPPERAAANAPQLTDRETEVLRMVAKGLTYRQIAERLFLSHRTVQNHVQNTLNKLQLHNRVELVRYAIERGLDG